MTRKRAAFAMMLAAMVWFLVELLAVATFCGTDGTHGVNRSVQRGWPRTSTDRIV